MFHPFIKIICTNITVILLFGNCRINEDQLENFKIKTDNYQLTSNSLISSRKLTEALAFLKSINDTCFNEDDKLYVVKYHNIGLVYYLNLNWELALKNFNKSLTFAISFNDTMGIIENYVYLCSTHLNSRQFISGTKYIDTLFHLTKKYSHYKYEYYKLKALTEFLQHKYSNAEFYSTNALNEISIVPNISPVTITHIFNLAAMISMNLNKFNLAKNLIDSALKYNNGLFNNSSCNINDLFLLTNKMQIKINESIYKNDVLNETEIIKDIYFIDSLSNYFKYSDRESFMQNNYYLNHFYTFSLKYFFWLNHINTNVKYLKLALYFISKYKSQSLILDHKFHIRVLNDKDNLNDYIKYFGILERFNLTDSLDNIEMPSNHYIKKLSAIEKLNNEWNSINKVDLDTLDAFDFSDKIIISAKKNAIAKLYFYIGSNHYNANTIYGILLYDGKITNFVNEEFKEISDAILNFKSNLYEIKNIKAIKNYSYYLYKILLEKVLKKIPTGTNIQIIADNLLQNLNFESFICDTINNNITFLLDRFNISYPLIVDENYSANVIDQIEKIRFIGWSDRKTLKRQYYSSLHLPELPETINEIENITKILPKRKKYIIETNLGSHATKNSLVEESKNVDVLHIALHGEIGTNRLNSKLYFRSKRKGRIDTLFSYEILFSKLKPKIVCLSACNTASGKVHLSEGVFSTARSFKVVGANMIVASYGDASDTYSRQYFTELYKIMFASDTVNVTMGSIAKRNLLVSNPKLRETPWLWSNIFVYQ